ncbi:MAG: polyprenyl synthetase family protein [Candidatus Nanoarchaeia archaeon]|nr:polyprenyl synthetase family protein [Candidatus Haiyanarchaeum thermophilum]MCW1302873.1 polyprenyl synthetase family protein [Candidatus Haiyanarchaeum thermophilum]MCW1303553.1 polyprenyl synthetase family protein [Candidatus Haiyanarchaeum thermophilum]MCW1306235.1 polyprenyl synthetase family protein [Candidatus Haiyanarchaeum thermophilum]MCW1307311.1 polyprenyl synthetase family protein [Candidatus Haiyanarchaeum thermophilum]
MGFHLFKREAKLNSILEKVTKVIDPIITELLVSYTNQRGGELVTYQISTGGKRIRPTIAILSCKLLGGKLEDVIYGAAGLEILHNYSLIVDDIIDHSILRRGRPTTWYKFGKAIAECIAVDYAAAIFQAANRCKNPSLISEIYARTMKNIVDGEILDLLFEQAGREDEPYILQNRFYEIDDEDYIEMISKKTASLFQACCEVGAICANATPQQLEALRNYGFYIGLAFQIRDDMLDIFGEEKVFGKKVGKDIVERKLGNIVLLYTLKELPLGKKEDFLKILRKMEINEEDVKRALRLIGETSASQKSYELGRKFVEMAKAQLNDMPNNKYKDMLERIADFIMEREK